MILYLCGPMTGIRKFNYPAFFQAAKDLRGAGYAVINPPESDSPELQLAALSSETGDWADLPPGDTLIKIIRQNVDDVLSSDAIAVLPGAHNSMGARMEIAIGERIGIQVSPVRDFIWATL